MGTVKKVLIAVVFATIVIQFFRPKRNENNQATRADIGKVLIVPKRLDGILKRSCYDCHSNTTRYPWYAEVQPFGWWLAGHISEGKEELNFNEFGNYSRRRQLSKLKAVANSIEDGTMPLSSYTLIHSNAKLSATEKKLMISWFHHVKDSLTIIK